MYLCTFNKHPYVTFRPAYTNAFKYFLNEFNHRKRNLKSYFLQSGLNVNDWLKAFKKYFNSLVQTDF